MMTTSMMAASTGNEFDLSLNSGGGNRKRMRRGNQWSNSWHSEHLPKNVRKGKSYEEIQELRKQYYTKRTGVVIED